MSVHPFRRNAECAAPANGSPAHAVLLQVPLDVSYISTVRLITAALAARCRLSVDGIEDVVVAVDEACGLLMLDTFSEASLELHYHLRTGALSIGASVIGEFEPDRSGLSWSLLQALATSVTVRQASGRVTIVLTKRGDPPVGPDYP